MSDYRGFCSILAKEFQSSDRAVMFGQIQWSINHHKDRREIYQEEYFADGKWWMKDTDKAWARYGSWKTERAWQRDKAWLKENGWIFIEKFRKASWDHTCYIAVNEEKLKELYKKDAEECQSVVSDMDETSVSGSRRNVGISLDETSLSSSPIDHNYISPMLTLPEKPKMVKSAKRGKSTPRDFIPDETHKSLVSLWKTHINTNSHTNRSKFTDVDLSYQIELLLNQSQIHSPQVNPNTLAAFFIFLTQCMGAKPPKWNGWGKNLLSIPEALKIKSGDVNSKFEKAWAEFAPIYEREKNQWSEQEKIKKQKEAEMAAGIDLPF